MHLWDIHLGSLLLLTLKVDGEALIKCSFKMLRDELGLEFSVAVRVSKVAERLKIWSEKEETINL